MSGDVVAFLKEQAARFPVPSKAEQLNLGHRIQAGLKEDASPAQRRAGERARHRLISGNLRLVFTVAKRYQARIRYKAAISFEDLVQEGSLGLNRAALKFNAEAGYCFSTYAYWWIQQSIQRAIELQNGTIRRPIDSQNIVNRWRYKPHDQSLDEFCERWNLTREKVLKELQQTALTNCVSLDAKASCDGDSSALAELVAAPSDPDADDVEAFRAALEAMADWLPDDLALVELNHSGTRQRELAELEGMSKAQIALHMKNAKQRLRGVVDADTKLLLVA